MTEQKIKSFEDAEKAIESEISQVISKFGTTDRRWNAYIEGLITALGILRILKESVREVGTDDDFRHDYGRLGVEVAKEVIRRVLEGEK